MSESIDNELNDEQPKKRSYNVGNRFWEARSSHGCKPIFPNPEALWVACCEYFQWVEDNPLWENKVAQFQGGVVDMPAAKMRVMTLTGCCLFLDITLESWSNYRKKDGFFGVCKSVETTIREQKFAGASAGLFNPMIIARDLGLKDNSTQEITGRDGGPVEIEMTDREKARLIAFALAKGVQDSE